MEDDEDFFAHSHPVLSLGVWSRSVVSGSWPFSIMASLGTRHIAQVAMSHYTQSYFCFDHLQPSIMFGRHRALGPQVVVSPFKIIVSAGVFEEGLGRVGGYTIHGQSSSFLTEEPTTQQLRTITPLTTVTAKDITKVTITRIPFDVPLME